MENQPKVRLLVSKTVDKVNFSFVTICLNLKIPNEF